MIRKGADWGTAITAPVRAREVRSDAELVEVLSDVDGPPPLARGGDVHRALGSPARPEATRRLPIDLIAVEGDGQHLTAVAHVVARRAGSLGWWRGPIVAVMNVNCVGRWDVATRAHPNDGWLDAVEVSPAMSLRARWQASRRLVTGSHLPHPDISARRVREASFEFDRPLRLWVDGVERGDVSTLSVRAVADGGEIFI